MEKRNCAAIAREVLAAAGGVANVESVRACLSRLRLVARRASLVDTDAANRIEGVRKVIVADGQFQFVVGKDAAALTEELGALGCTVLGMDTAPVVAAALGAADGVASVANGGDAPESKSDGDGGESSVTKSVAKKGSARTRALSFLQELGKTFMFPVSTLSAMGLLVGIGSAITSPYIIESFPALGNEVVQAVFSFMNTVGGFGFTYLPVMFAMAIPFGLSKRNKGVGAIAAFAGYVSMNLAINFVLGYQGALAETTAMKAAGQSMVLGIQSIEMGVLGGIVVGLVTNALLNRFQDIVLPDAFSFFGGIRFVPIASIVTNALIGIVIPMVWPVVNMGISGIGYAIMGAGVFGPFLYGLFNAILKPFGMHHILLALVRFTEAGGTAVVDGQTISGALNIFYAELNAGAPISRSATAFLSQGFMPTFIFALPAVCLAIYTCARKDRRESIKGLLISAAAVSIVTGISEPTEFLFLFIALPLYVFHAVMSGLSLMVMNLVGVSIGNTDGGIIDWVIFGIMQGPSTKWWLVIPVGIVWFAIYFFVFRWYIQHFDIPTPGRESVDDEGDVQQAFTKGHGIYDPAIILGALGGSGNITSLDNCVTRLRLEVKDASAIDEPTLKKAGALAVVKLDDHNVQVVIGAQVQTVKTGVENLMNGR